MKYYSELTTEMYDTIKELEVAELEALYKEQDRERAEVNEAVKKVIDLIKEFEDKYGIYTYNGHLVKLP